MSADRSSVYIETPVQTTSTKPSKTSPATGRSAAASGGPSTDVPAIDGQRVRPALAAPAGPALRLGLLRVERDAV